MTSRIHAVRLGMRSWIAIGLASIIGFAAFFWPFIAARDSAIEKWDRRNRKIGSGSDSPRQGQYVDMSRAAVQQDTCTFINRCTGGVHIVD